MAYRIAVTTALLAGKLLAAQVPAPARVDLTGKVLTEAGSPVAGVHVKAAGNKASPLELGASDASGSWRLSVLPGTYRVTFEAPGFQEQQLDNVDAPGTERSVTLLPD